MRSTLWLALLMATVVAGAQTKLQEGMTHLENENYGPARAAFREAIAVAPKSGAAYFYLGEAHYAEENYDSASVYYQRGLEADNRCDVCQTGIGKTLLDQKKTDEARKAFEMATRYTRSKDPKTFSAIGAAYLGARNPNPEEAVLNFTKARDLDTRNPVYFIQLGDAELAKNNPGAAMTAYEFAAEKDPKNAEVFVKMASIWSNSNLEQAETKLLECIKNSPNYAPAYKLLITVYGKMRQYQKITPLLDKYVSLVGLDDLPARARFVKFLTYQAKDYDRAISEANIVLKADAKYYEMHRWLAWANFEKGNFPASLSSSNTFFSLVGDRKIITSDYDYLAKALEKTGDYAGAETNFLKVVEVDSARTDVYDYMVKMYSDLSRDADVARIITLKQGKGLASNTDLTYLGLALYKSKLWAQADSTFAKVCEKVPTYAYAWNMRAKCNDYLDTTEPKAFLAKPYQERMIALSAEPKWKGDKSSMGWLSDAHYYMGTYYFNAQSNKELAIDSFRKALVANPENSSAKDALTQLGVE